MLLHLTLIQTTSNYIQILIASALVFRLSNLVQLLERLLFKRSFLPVSGSGSDLMLSWSKATLLSSWMWRRSMFGRNCRIQGRRGQEQPSCMCGMWRRSMSGGNVRIQGRRGQEQPCFRLGCEEGRCPAEIAGSMAVVVKNNLAVCVGCEGGRCPAETSGSKAVVVKNNLAVCVGCEGGRCPAETSGSKAVVVKNNLAFVLDVKKVDVRPKLPDLVALTAAALLRE